MSSLQEIHRENEYPRAERPGGEDDAEHRPCRGERSEAVTYSGQVPVNLRERYLDFDEIIADSLKASLDPIDLFFEPADALFEHGILRAAAT
jgi:hypothetical protein